MSDADVDGRAYDTSYLAAYREKLSALEQTAAEAFDKVIVTLSSGALVLTMTLVGTVFPERLHLYILILAWTAFTAALTLTLMSLKTSREAMRRQIEIVDAVWSKGGTFEQYKNKPNAWTRRFNNGALVAFVSGTVLTVIFVALNAT